MRRNTRIVIILGTVTLLILSFSASILLRPSQQKIALKIFTAGSLAEPFGGMPDGDDMESLFEELHPDVDVQVLSGGSVDMIRRVIELNQSCDVLAVADYSLVPAMMINVSDPTADFVITFAKNSMVLAYTDGSRYAAELNQENWYDILRRQDVRFGFSNPNDDPCGYRTLILLALAEDYYGDATIFEDLIVSNTNIVDISVEGGTSTISVPSSLAVVDDSRLMVRSAEAELTNALESGSIDYLFTYESIAIRHASSGVRYLELPRQINLNDSSLASEYRKIIVRLFADSAISSRGRTVSGAPIAYGVTIPRNAENPHLGAAFIGLLFGDEGQAVMRRAGQEPLVPPVAGYWRDQVPESLMSLVI